MAFHALWLSHAGVALSRHTARLPAAHFFNYGLGFLIDGQVQSAQIFADDSEDQELHAGKQKNRRH